MTPGMGLTKGKLLSVPFAGCSKCISLSEVKLSLTNKSTTCHLYVGTFPVPLLSQSLSQAHYTLKGEKRLIKSSLSNHHPPNHYHQHSFSSFPSP